MLLHIQNRKNLPSSRFLVCGGSKISFGFSVSTRLAPFWLTLTYCTSTCPSSFAKLGLDVAKLFKNGFPGYTLLKSFGGCGLKFILLFEAGLKTYWFLMEEGEYS